MKCMNPKCDSTEFSINQGSSLTDKSEPDRFWVNCDECLTVGPTSDSSQEAKSYFADKPGAVDQDPVVHMRGESPIMAWAKKTRTLSTPRVDLSAKWSDSKSNPLEDINRFLEQEKYRGDPEMVIDIMKPLTPGPTQVTGPTPAWEKATVSVGGKTVSFDVASNDDAETMTRKLLGAIKEQIPELKLEKDSLEDFSDETKKEAQAACEAWDTAITNPEPTINMANYPHKCDCGAHAYVGANSIECTDKGCKNYVKPKS